MKIYLISNNLLIDNLEYDNNANLDLIRMSRPLSYEGELLAQKLSNLKELEDVTKIYSSFYSSALSTSKYLSNRLGIDIYMNETLNECRVGSLGSKNMKMVKGLQDHEFTYKLSGGESLIDVGNRLNNFIKGVINKEENAAIYTHKRAILGFLLKYAKVGYNLDENLILEFNDKIIYDDTETEADIYEIIIDNNQIVDINVL